MSRVAIVTDSTADVPAEFLEKYEIHVVPLYVHFGNKSFKDGVELPPQTFFPMLKESMETPTTSQPAVGEFVRLYEKLISEGKKVVSIHISSVLSGTFQSASLAKLSVPAGQVEVIDSANVTLSLGWQVIAAAEAAAKGWDLDDIVTLVREVGSQVKLYFAIDTLEYLYKGGRIGKVAAFLGTMLNFKPIITIENGGLVPYARVRSHKQVISKLVQLAEEALQTRGKIRIGVIHTAAPEKAAELRERLKDKLGLPELPLVTEAGAVLGTHVGPGALAIAFY
ncbi:MAG: DegV family protein [Firmicutes bacterium]|nr:DegV family protein [Bacillota bacterium]